MTKIIEIETCRDCPRLKRSICQWVTDSDIIPENCSLPDKLKISVDISNATSLTWDEEHSAAYLRPEDIIKVKTRKKKKEK